MYNFCTLEVFLLVNTAILISKKATKDSALHPQHQFSPVAHTCPKTTHLDLSSNMHTRIYTHLDGISLACIHTHTLYSTSLAHIHFGRVLPKDNTS